MAKAKKKSASAKAREKSKGGGKGKGKGKAGKSKAEARAKANAKGKSQSDASKAQRAKGKAGRKAGKARGDAAARRAGSRRSQPSLEGLARRIVKAASDPEVRLGELYASDCVSEEASGDVAHGIAGLEEKMRRWEQMQQGARFEPRHVWLGKNTVCIEWDAKVDLRDGRSVELREVAVHEVENGKIVAERYYYNPMVLGPPASAVTSGS